MYIDAHAHYTLMHKDAYPFRDQKYILRCTMKQFKEKTSQSIKLKLGYWYGYKNWDREKDTYLYKKIDDDHLKIFTHTN